MGMVVVISLPFIIFCVLLGFGCYFLGRARGRREMVTNPQVYGVPTPPPDLAGKPDHPPRSVVAVWYRVVCTLCILSATFRHGKNGVECSEAPASGSLHIYCKKLSVIMIRFLLLKRMKI
ncbi:hypothetical protein MLD38_037293 [Melastoma candidum]|uniref:Uncharacterized protein n=1 Tax=Melastoma candidum TaxID=119954 RepID=A0ACB9LMV0_9MYRT|nr:hypothetical protein MLD38_037293 [Melastoma candidum]